MRAIQSKSATAFDTRTRSTLEARWAVFFRELNLRWKYEPETFTGDGCRYTPDFLVENLGYVEIKPTIQLFVLESSKRVAKIIAANPNIQLYVFCAGSVAFDVVALYRGGVICAPRRDQMNREISRCREGNTSLSEPAQDTDIKRAMTIANATNFGEWQTAGEIIQSVMNNLCKLATTSQ